MSPGVSFFIDHCARVDAAKGTSRDEVCERDYPVLFSDDSTLTTVPPLQINPQCGIIQPGRAGIGEVVFEWQWRKEHPSVSIHGCSVLIKEEGFSEEDFFPGSPPFQIRFLHLEWHLHCSQALQEIHQGLAFTGDIRLFGQNHPGNLYSLFCLGYLLEVRLAEFRPNKFGLVPFIH